MIYYALLDFSSFTDKHIDYLRSKIQIHFEDKSTLKRKESVAARALLCFMLKECYGITDFAVSSADNGKPYITEGRVQFNLSHSGDYALCVCGEEKIGCDIEQIKGFKEKVAKRFFCDGEYRLLQKSADSDSVFTKMWTLKESALKYSGQGVSGGLDQYDFSEYYICESFSAYGLCFNCVEIPGYAVSICAEGPTVSQFSVSNTDLINKDF